MDRTKDPTKKKKIISLTVFGIGLAVLAAGLVFLVLNLTRGTAIEDGEYLVSAKEWALEGGDCVQAKCGDSTKCVDENGESSVTCKNGGVIWKFTEIGKGTLTTNNHVNDYDFIWALEDGKLKIETDWLYDLENEYEYSIDQNSGVLTLKDGEEEIKFIGNFEN